jgi:uncharacterized membrane-anchored protein
VSRLGLAHMTQSSKECATDAFTKVPEVTLAFWILKIAATMLGETGGDSVTCLGRHLPLYIYRHD